MFFYRCVQTALLLCSFLQVLAVDNVDFGEHVETQTGARDRLSRKHHRVYQLYSRTSGKHVQVLGRKIAATGEDGDKYAQLVVEADTFGSQVRIRGKETNFYLCMNRRGKLVGRKANSANAECVFIEMVLENNYTAWMSARYTGWYIGFTKKGRARRGPQTLPNQQEVHFMKRFPPENNEWYYCPTTDLAPLCNFSGPEFSSVLQPNQSSSRFLSTAAQDA
ncbi:fibroblast growth factor 18b precursor [Silurus asotus]|uniref:Fibroblast growth factor 18b n=1 Tax=Silurus asotus TaxID=30991 RepID=A0AAD5FQ41_SILAS|nr:fibroblast growth factor 18b precursor [Silurus asotus]